MKLFIFIYALRHAAGSAKWEVTLNPIDRIIVFEQKGGKVILCENFRLTSPAIPSTKILKYPDLSVLGISGEVPCLRSDYGTKKGAAQCANTDFMEIETGDYRRMKIAENCDAVRAFIERNEKLKKLVFDENKTLLSLSFGEQTDRKASQPLWDLQIGTITNTVGPMGTSVDCYTRDNQLFGTVTGASKMHFSGTTYCELLFRAAGYNVSNDEYTTYNEDLYTVTVSKREKYVELKGHRTKAYKKCAPMRFTMDKEIGNPGKLAWELPKKIGRELPCNDDLEKDPKWIQCAKPFEWIKMEGLKKYSALICERVGTFGAVLKKYVDEINSTNGVVSSH